MYSTIYTCIIYCIYVYIYTVSVHYVHCSWERWTTVHNYKKTSYKVTCSLKLKKFYLSHEKSLYRYTCMYYCRSAFFYHVLQLVLNPQEATVSPKGMKLDSIVPHSLKGFFKTREELDDYEKTWHIYIYQPTWNELKSKVHVVWGTEMG